MGETTKTRNINLVSLPILRCYFGFSHILPLDASTKKLPLHTHPQIHVSHCKAVVLFIDSGINMAFRSKAINGPTNLMFREPSIGSEKLNTPRNFGTNRIVVYEIEVMVRTSVAQSTNRTHNAP